MSVSKLTLTMQRAAPYTRRQETYYSLLTHAAPRYQTRGCQRARDVSISTCLNSQLFVSHVLTYYWSSLVYYYSTLTKHIPPSTSYLIPAQRVALYKCLCKTVKRPSL